MRPPLYHVVRRESVECRGKVARGRPALQQRVEPADYLEDQLLGCIDLSDDAGVTERELVDLVGASGHCLNADHRQALQCLMHRGLIEMRYHRRRK